MAPLLPTTQDIGATTTEQLAVVGGVVSDTFDDGRRLFLRAILPAAEEVQPKDVIEGGIAVIADEEEIQVHPYVFRKVCRNGAVMPQVVESRCIRRVPLDASSEEIEAVLSQLREAVCDSSAPEVFCDATRRIRSAMGRKADFAVVHLLLLSAMPRLAPPELRADIIQRFMQERDRSMFGLMNAVTSVARDQKDPEVRWRLEELGGGVPALRLPEARPGDNAAELALAEA